VPAVRRSKLLVVAAAVALIGAAQLLSGFAVAAPNPPGNNGTIKVDDVPFDDAPDNEPHVGCTFQVDFYGYDEGDLFADVTFESHPPTGPVVTLLTDTVFIGEDDNSGGGSEAGLDASETYTLDFTGIEPHPNQGFHVKLTINADGSQGADVKHKVFWVTGCPPPVTTTSTTTSTTSSTTSTTAPTTTSTTTTTLPTSSTGASTSSSTSSTTSSTTSTTQPTSSSTTTSTTQPTSSSTTTSTTKPTSSSTTTTTQPTSSSTTSTTGASSTSGATSTSEVTTTSRETTTSSVGGTGSSAPSSSVGGVSSTQPGGGVLALTGRTAAPMAVAGLALLGLGAASLFAGMRRRRRA
jgi:hypothetical protein